MIVKNKAKKMYHITDLERIGGTFIIEDMTKKNPVFSYYRGTLALNGQCYHVCVRYDRFGVGFVIGLYGKEPYRELMDIREYFISCASNEEFPDFAKCIVKRINMTRLFRFCLICSTIGACIFLGCFLLSDKNTFWQFICMLCICMISLAEYLNWRKL